MHFLMSPMGIEITDELIQSLQKYLGVCAAYLHTGIAAGTWILAGGALVAVVAIVSQQEKVRLFFRKKRIHK